PFLSFTLFPFTTLFRSDTVLSRPLFFVVVDGCEYTVAYTLAIVGVYFFKPEVNVAACLFAIVAKHGSEIVAPPHGVINQTPVPYGIVGSPGDLLEAFFAGG